MGTCAESLAKIKVKISKRSPLVYALDIFFVHQSEAHLKKRKLTLEVSACEDRGLYNPW